jgi:hypothetical protein
MGAHDARHRLCNRELGQLGHAEASRNRAQLLERTTEAILDYIQCILLRKLACARADAQGWLI